MAFVTQHPEDLPDDYPAHLEEWVELPSGESLWIRPIVPSDSLALAAEFAAADDDTVYMRFFNPIFRLTASRLRYLTEIDYRSHLALAAMLVEGDRSEGVAIARFVTRTETDVEGAIVVKPEFRRRGVARLMLDRLVSAAATLGYATMSASYLEENDGAAALLAAVGFRNPTTEDGIVHVSLELGAEWSSSLPSR